MKIKVSDILPNPEQPRVHFDQVELENLAESIREHGVIHPIIVEKSDNRFFILHDGERRLRAAKLAGLDEIPAHVTPSLNGTGSRDRLVRAMVSNIQRSDLNPIEEALAYQRMMTDLGLKITQISRILGVSHARVTSRIKLLKLDEPIQQEIIKGRLHKDERTTDALLSVQDSKIRIDLALRASERRMSAKGVIEACRRINQHLQEERLPKSDIPAIWQATRKVGTVNDFHWNALAQVGKLPPWILLEITARDTCKKCSWYDMASESICKECPLPQMIAMMIGKANNG